MVTLGADYDASTIHVSGSPNAQNAMFGTLKVKSEVVVTVRQHRLSTEGP